MYSNFILKINLKLIKLQADKLVNIEIEVR